MSRTALFLIAIFCLSLGAAAQTAPRKGPMDSPDSVELSSAAEVPMLRVHRLPAVEVSIDGSKPYVFVVDTGANILGIAPKVAEDLRLAAVGTDEMGNANVRVATLSIGAARFHGLIAAVVPFFAGKDEQGVIGINLLRDLLLTFDYPGGKLRLERGALPPADGRRVLACETSEGGGLVVPITVAEKPRQAVLDTGASAAVILPELLETELAWKESPVVKGLATGPSRGTAPFREAVLAGDVRLGAWTVANPAVGLGRGPKTLLGSGLLEQFAVTVDMKNARLRLAREGPETITLAPQPGPSPRPAGEPARLPETVEGRRLSAFLAAARTGTEAAVREFIEKNFSPAALKETPVEPRLRRIFGLVSRSGPFELARILPPGPDRAGAIVVSKKDGKSYELSLELEGGPERGVLGVDLDEAVAEGGGDTPKKTDAELVSAVDGWVTTLAGEGSFSGVVLLARDGKPFFQKAWGQADRGLASANRVDTKFNVGSIGKAFTRAAIMDLVAAGRLSLDDTVAKHLPAAKIPSSDRMTIRQLLEMSSGLGDIFGENYEATPKERLRNLEDFLRLFEGQPLRFEPGKGKSYSNAGYVVLGLIIEKVSGRPYWDFVKDRVFTPAGMPDTGPFGPDEVVANRAVGYTKTEKGEWRSNLYALPGRASSAGGVFSTAGDLLRFAGSPSGGQGRLGIAGGTAGANAVLESPGPAGVTVIVLANLDPPSAERVATRVRGWAKGL